MLPSVLPKLKRVSAGFELVNTNNSLMKPLTNFVDETNHASSLN